jgi:hypothetical protein
MSYVAQIVCITSGVAAVPPASMETRFSGFSCFYRSARAGGHI